MAHHAKRPDQALARLSGDGPWPLFWNGQATVLESLPTDHPFGRMRLADRKSLIETRWKTVKQCLQLVTQCERALPSDDLDVAAMPLAKVRTLLEKLDAMMSRIDDRMKSVCEDPYHSQYAADTLARMLECKTKFLEARSRILSLRPVTDAPLSTSNSASLPMPIANESVPFSAEASLSIQEPIKIDATAIVTAILLGIRDRRAWPHTEPSGSGPVDSESP